MTFYEKAVSVKPTRWYLSVFENNRRLRPSATLLSAVNKL
jgi:hypothetical protein